MKTDWVEIRDYYVHHPKASQKQIAEKFNVNIRTLQNRISLEGWNDKRNGFNSEIVKKCEEKIIEREVDRRLKANEDHLRLYDNCTKIANLLCEQYIRELEQGVAKPKANAYSLDAILKAITSIQKGQRLALNIDKEEVTDTEPEMFVVEGLDMKKI